MEILGYIIAFLLLGFASAAFFKFVDDWFIEDFDAHAAAVIVFLWPLFWFFFILKVVTYPVFWLCGVIFD